MRTIIRRDAPTDVRFIQQIPDDAHLPADAMSLSTAMYALMLTALGATDETLPSALSAITGATFVNDDGSADITPPDSFVRYIVRVRGTTLEVLEPTEMVSTAVIATPSVDSVFSAADWTLIVSTLADGDEAAAIAAIAQAEECTEYPQTLPEAAV
jgi:hypothetical protein